MQNYLTCISSIALFFLLMSIGLIFAKLIYKSQDGYERESAPIIGLIAIIGTAVFTLLDSKFKFPMFVFTIPPIGFTIVYPLTIALGSLPKKLSRTDWIWIIAIQVVITIIFTVIPLLILFR